MECLSYCIANTIDLARLDQYFKSNPHSYRAIRTRDVIKLYFPENTRQLIFVFKNRTVIFWGLKRYRASKCLDEILPYIDKPLTHIIHDEFSYQIRNKIAIEPHAYFDVDCLTISQEFDCDELRLSLSYGFSQSVKLQSFESRIDNLAEKYTPLIEKVSELKRRVFSKKPISRTRIRHANAEILSTKTELNLISNFLYHPKYFWQHPTLEEYFTMLEHYLHIQRRVSAINHRLDTLDEIFHMFNQYLEGKHAHHLEIIIIVLIAIEIIFSVLGFHY